MICKLCLTCAKMAGIRAALLFDNKVLVIDTREAGKEAFGLRWCFVYVYVYVLTALKLQNNIIINMSRLQTDTERRAVSLLY